MSSTPTPPAMPMPSDAPTSSPSPSLPRQPCRYLTSPGGCRYGDACRFIHPSDAIVQQQQQSQQQQQQLQPPHPSHMQSQMQPHMPIPMQPSHIHIPLQQQSSQDPSSQSSPPPVQMAYPPGYPFYSPNETNFEEGQTPYMYPPPSHTQTHININMPPSPYQTPTPTHFPSPSLTPSPYQGPHLPPPYQASPSLQPFPTTANPTYPQPPPQQLTPYQMYAYQYQQQQLIPYMQNAAHAYAAAGYTPQQQQQMLHQLAMSLQMMPPMVNPPMETRTMHLTRRDKNNINAQGMCKYYVAGKCNYGGTCRFPHDVMSAMAYQQANYGLTNGSPHPRTPQPQPQSDVDTLTETMDNVHLQSPPSSSRQRRNKSGSSSPSQQVCRYYHQGTCRFGDQCKFQHIEMTTPSTSTSSTSTSTSTPATYNDGDKLGTSNMDRQHVWKSLQITEKSSDIIDTTSSIPSSHTLIIYHSRFSSTHTFMDLVQHEHDACITFLHDLIEFLENVHGIMDYSIRIEQTVATEEEREECKEGDSSINPTGSFRVRVLYGGDLLNANTRTTPASDQLSKTLIHTTPHNRIWFDYHGRPALIITPQSHVERPSQLDDTQLYALLCDPITQLRREYEHVLAKSRRDEEEGEHELKEMITPRRLPPMTFQHLIINVGGYRRIRDLHIKMTLDPSLFTLITSTWPAALQQRWNAAQQSSNTSTETATTANNAGKKKPIKSASANKENRKSITNGTAPTTSGKGKPATILPQQQQQQTNGTRGWASIVNKTTSTTPATTIAPSILPTSSYTNTSSSESSTSSSPNASPVTAIRR